MPTESVPDAALNVAEKLMHGVLVEQARRWLVAIGCTVVLAEPASRVQEQVDLIGWDQQRTGLTSFLVACVVTRADFQADLAKFYRKFPEQGMGNLRYYCAPVGVLTPEEVPTGWGLLEWNSAKGKFYARPNAGRIVFKGAKDEETVLLLTALRRLGIASGDRATIKVLTSSSIDTGTVVLEPERELTESS